MSFICDYLAAIAVALVASTVAWLYGGARGDLLTPVVPWMLVILFEVLIFFPQRRGYETTYEARKRFWKELKRDPLVWTALALVLLLAIPFVNNGLCPSCHAQEIANGAVAAPKISLLPFCVDRLDHLNVFWWFSLSMLAMLVVRRSLSRHGQRFVIAALVWNAAALAIFGFVEVATGAKCPFWITNLDHCPYRNPTMFFSTFGYPNMAGSYFVLAFGLAIAMWRDCLTRFPRQGLTLKPGQTAQPRKRQFWKRNIYLVPAALCFYASISTLSRAAIIMAVGTALIYAYHAFASFIVHKHRVGRVRMAAIWLVIFILAILAAVVYLPSNIQKEVNSIDTVGVLDRVSGRGNRLTTVAWKLFTQHKLFGCGGWGFRHLGSTTMDKKDFRLMSSGPGSMNVHNDYMQFLAEHGLVGFGLMIAVVVLLIIPVGRTWRRLSKSSQFLKDKHTLPRPHQIFALPAPAFLILVACMCPLLHAFGDCPLRSLAVLITFFIALASIPGFLPHEDEESTDTESTPSETK